jgi:hypothetical protein
MLVGQLLNTLNNRPPGLVEIDSLDDGEQIAEATHDNWDLFGIHHQEVYVFIFIY